MSKSSETEALPENQWKDISPAILADLEEVGFEGTQRFPLEEFLSRSRRSGWFMGGEIMPLGLCQCELLLRVSWNQTYQSLRMAILYKWAICVNMQVLFFYGLSVCRERQQTKDPRWIG